MSGAAERAARGLPVARIEREFVCAPYELEIGASLNPLTLSLSKGDRESRRNVLLAASLEARDLCLVVGGRVAHGLADRAPPVDRRLAGPAPRGVRELLQ
jgi:hypothetical protein